MNRKVKLFLAILPILSFAGQKSVDESFTEGDVFELRSGTSYKNVDEDGKWGSAVGDETNMCRVYVDKKLAGKVVNFDYLRKVKVKSVSISDFVVSKNDYKRVFTYSIEDEPTTEGKTGVLEKIICENSVKSWDYPKNNTPTIQSISKVFGVILDVTSDKSKKESLSVDATKSPRSVTGHGKAQQPI